MLHIYIYIYIYDISRLRVNESSSNPASTMTGVQRTALFLVITQTVVVIYYRRFGTNHRVPSSIVMGFDPQGKVESFLTLEDGTDRFSRNVGKKVLLAA